MVGHCIWIGDVKDFTQYVFKVRHELLHNWPTLCDEREKKSSYYMVMGVLYKVCSF